MVDEVVITDESRKFFRFFGFMLTLVVLFGAYTFFISRNFLAVLQTECDPREQSCFVYTCDAAIDECTGDPLQDTEFFGLIQKKGYDFPDCDLNEQSCRDQVVCHEGDAVCDQLVCSEQTVPEGARCSTAEDIPLYLEIEQSLLEEDADENTDADVDADVNDDEDANENIDVDETEEGAVQEDVENIEDAVDAKDAVETEVIDDATHDAAPTTATTTATTTTDSSKSNSEKK